MDNKGMTLVELLITFVLLMIVVVGMFNLILDLRLDLDDKKIVKEYIEYSDFINHDIQYDLVTRQPLAIAISGDGQAWNCYYSGLYFNDDKCEVQDNGEFKVDARLSPEDDQSVKGTVNVHDKNLCNGMYPCAIYGYYTKHEATVADVAFDAIALNTSPTLEDSPLKDYGYGIKYGKLFEAIPHQKYIDKKIVKAYIEFDNDDKNLDGQRNLIINFPLYMTGNDQNYGFMIVYPMFSLEK